MRFFDRMKGKAAIIGTAEHFGQTPEQVKADMLAAIAEAWENPEPEVQKLQKELFPNGRPTPEEFIAVVSKNIKKNN